MTSISYYTLDELLTDFQIPTNDWVVFYNAINPDSTRAWHITNELAFLDELLKRIIKSYKYRSVYFSQYGELLDLEQLTARIVDSMDQYIPLIVEQGKNYIRTTSKHEVDLSRLLADIVNSNETFSGGYSVPQGTTDWSTLTETNNHLSALNRNKTNTTTTVGTNEDKYMLLKKFVEDLYDKWVKDVCIYYYG